MIKKLVYLLFLLLILSIFFSTNKAYAGCSGSYTSTGLYKCNYNIITGWYCTTDGTVTENCSWYGDPTYACAASQYMAESCSASATTCVVQNKFDGLNTSSCTYVADATPTPVPAATATPVPAATATPVPPTPIPCSVPAPTNLRPDPNTGNNITATSADLRWTPGLGSGDLQRLRLDDNQAQTQNNCTTGNGCLIKEQNLTRNRSSYNTATVPAPPVSLLPGKRYYWRVINRNNNNGGCIAVADDSFITDCQVDVSTSPASSLASPISQSSSVTITATVTKNVDIIDHVNFSVINSVNGPGCAGSVVSLGTPVNDTASPYRNSTTTQACGQATVKATVVRNGGSTWCTSTVDVFVGTVPTPTPTPTPTVTPTPLPGACPVPSATCGAYDPATGTTPVVWDWTPTQASGLQVWDGGWWFNDWTSPPKTTTGIPAGTTVNGRCTYDFTTFSATSLINCPAPTPTETPTPLPTLTPTPVPPGPWKKLMNTSFIASNSLTSLIPLSLITPYDGDDDASPNFIIGEGGLVAAPSVNLTGINPAAQPSVNNWLAAYSPTYLLTPNAYLSYIKARKQHSVITLPDLSEITGSGIYVYQGTDPLVIDASNSSVFNNKNVVLITQEAVNINADLNPLTSALAVVAPTITFDAAVTQAAGVFIANSIDTGSTVNQGLKIIGNLVSQGIGMFTFGRAWVDLNRPSLFIKFDPIQYINLLPYLSTVNYRWNQTQ